MNLGKLLLGRVIIAKFQYLGCDYSTQVSELCGKNCQLGGWSENIRVEFVPMYFTCKFFADCLKLCDAFCLKKQCQLGKFGMVYVYHIQINAGDKYND